MAYCEIADVQALNPTRPTYSAGTKPTATQVEGYITDIAAEIDTALKARGLNTPVTAPTDFVAHLKQMNALGAAALADSAMFPEAMGPGASPHGAWLWGLYKGALKSLRESELPVGSGGESKPTSYAVEHPDDKGEPKFKKDKEF